MERVTIKDVAKVAGVSYATVSRALSGSPEVSEETRQRIDQLCREMGYMPNVMARAMVMKRSQIIGLIMPSINNSFMSELADSIEVKTREAGYNLMVCNTSYDPEQEKQAFELLLGRQADGIIFIPAGYESCASLQPFFDRAPVVVLSENLQEIPELCVSVDNSKGAGLGVEYLYSLGHRNILYLGKRQNSMTHKLRAEGYGKACKKLEIPADYLDSPFEKSTVEAGYTLAKEYLAGERKHTAIFCAADSLAIGVMKAADEAGVRIPEGLSLMGFDNIAFSALPRIDLTTVNQPERDMAAAGVELLLERIEKKESRPRHRMLTPSLVIRSSCREI